MAGTKTIYRNPTASPETKAPATKAPATPVSGTQASALAYTDEVAAATDHLYERVSQFIPRVEWPAYAPLIKAINDLKKKKNAVL